MPRLVIARPAKLKIFHNPGAPTGTPDEPSQIARLAANSPWAPGTKSGLAIEGNTITIGINSNILNTPTMANSSDTLERGRRQWLLVNRNATATNGAELVIMNTKEKAAI